MIDDKKMLHVVMIPDTKEPLFIASSNKAAMAQAAHIMQYIPRLHVVSLDNWLNISKGDSKPMHDVLNSEAVMAISWPRFEMAYRIVAFNYSLPDEQQKVLFTSRYGGVDIRNPFLSVCGRFYVNPIRTHGPDFINWFNGLDSLDGMPGMPSFNASLALLGQEWG